MNTNEILILVFGIICSLLSIAYFIPQVVKVIKTKNAASLSIYFCIFGILSSLVWIIFGSLIVNNLLNFSQANALVIGLPIIVTNCLLLVLQVILLVFKIKQMKFVLDNNIDKTRKV